MTNRNKMTPSRVPNLSANGTNTVKKKSSFGGGALKNKIFLFIFLPLMVIISGVTILFIVNAIKNDASVAVSKGDDYVYVLPMSERDAETDSKKGKNPFTATGLSPVALKGIMYNPEGSSYAILISSNKTFVKTVGDEIGDTGWTLTEINNSEVIVSKDEINETLTLQPSSDSGIEISPAS